MPVDEAAHSLIAPMLFLALHKHSIGACPVLGPDMDPTMLIDAQIDLVLHGLQRRPSPAQVAKAGALPDVKRWHMS